MKKQLLLALSSIVFLTGGAAYVHKNAVLTRAPAAHTKDLGLIRTHTENSSQMRGANMVAVPTIEKRKSDSNERIKSVEAALTNKMANDPRYTRVFDTEDLTRVSACAVSQAASQIGIEQFKEDISTQGTPGNRIFFHCMISVHSARVAYNRANGIETSKKAGNVAKKVGSSTVTPTESAGNDNNQSCSETNSCNGPREGDPDFVGPVQPGANSNDKQTSDETSDNGQISDPFAS